MTHLACFFIHITRCTENHIFFFQTSWKNGLSKKIALEYDLSRIIGKDHVSLSRKYDLNLRRKMQDDLFQKNTRKYDIFFRSFEKKVFSKRAAPWYDLSCIIWKDGIFFSKTRYFFLGKEVSDDLSQEIHGNMIWCHAPLPKKNQGWPYPAKNTPKGDWRSRLTSSKELQQFPVPSQRPLRAFSCIALQRKKPGNLIYRIEAWLLLQFIRLEIFYNE